jgi:flagellar protein FlgJ
MDTRALRAVTPANAMPNRMATATRRTAEEFEAVFLSSIMQTLFSGVATDSVFGGGQTESVYRSMLLQEYGKAATQRGGIGIADAVQREMLRLQEAAR